MNLRFLVKSCPETALYVHHMEASEHKSVKPDNIYDGVNSLRLGGLRMKKYVYKDNMK